MVNQLKIITMTRLALYDKHEGLADRAANDYFRHDYIYRNNLGTRLAVGCGSIIILLVYWLQAIIINEMDLFELNFQQYATDSLMFILAVLAVYSLIGTIQGTRQYYLIQKRLAQYQALVRQLERLEERAHKTYDDEAADAGSVKRTSTSVEKTTARTGKTLQPGHTAPPVRIAPPPQPTRQNKAERLTPSGYIKPQHPGLSDAATKPPHPMVSDVTRSFRPAPSDGVPRPLSPKPVAVPRPVPSPGHTTPHPSMMTMQDRPPKPQPSVLPEDNRPDTARPGDSVLPEDTKIPGRES